MRMTYGTPLRRCQSPILTAAARTRTSTSSSLSDRLVDVLELQDIRGAVLVLDDRLHQVVRLDPGGPLGRRRPEHARQHPSPVGPEHVPGGRPEAGPRHCVPQLALEPGAGDAEAHQLRDHLDEVGAADELDLIAHRPSRGEGVVLLAGVEAESQALLRPTERFKRSTGVARGVLDVDVSRARGAIEARIVQERGAEQQLTVIRDAARVSEALGDQNWRTVCRSMSPSVSSVAVRRAWRAAASASVRMSSSACRRVSPWTSRHVSGRPRPDAPVPPGTVALGSLDMCAPSFVAAPSVRRPWLDAQALIRFAARPLDRACSAERRRSADGNDSARVRSPVRSERAPGQNHKRDVTSCIRTVGLVLAIALDCHEGGRPRWHAPRVHRGAISRRPVFPSLPPREAPLFVWPPDGPL